MSEQVLVLKRNAEIDVRGLETDLNKIVNDLSLVSSIAIFDDESNREAKKIISESRKQFNVYDKRRIELKKELLSPYEKVEEIFKKYDVLHKEQINKINVDSKEYEENKRLIKEKEVIEYFNGLNEHSFLSFNHTGIKVINSGSLSKYKEEIDRFISKIETDIILINQQEEHMRIMSEYEYSLNATQAIIKVQEQVKREHELNVSINSNEATQAYKLVEEIEQETTTNKEIEEVEHIKKFRGEIQCTKNTICTVATVLFRKQYNIKIIRTVILINIMKKEK